MRSLFRIVPRALFGKWHNAGMNLTPPTPDALYEALSNGGVDLVIANFLSCPFTGRRYGPEIVGASEQGMAVWASSRGIANEQAQVLWADLVKALG